MKYSTEELNGLYVNNVEDKDFGIFHSCMGCKKMRHSVLRITEREIKSEDEIEMEYLMTVSELAVIR